MSRLKQLIHEIHRRSLWQVLSIYVVGGWIALQIVDTLAGALKLPDWAAPVAFVLLIIGLPLVLATAFVQEGIGPREPGELATTSGGTPIPSRATDGGTNRLLTWRNALAGGVVAFALWGIVATAWLFFGPDVGPRGTVAGTVQVPAIAGLPLTDLSQEGDNRYLGDGIAYALMDGLSDAGLYVTSAFGFREREQDVRHIGADLGVAYVMDGSVIRSGDQIRVSVRLVNASDGFTAWNEDFDDDSGDVLALQDRVVGSVVDQLRDEFGLTEQVPGPTGTTENPEAYNAYLQGRFHLERRGTNGIEAALKYFTLALSLDSLYALAWSGLADAQILTIPYEVEGIVRDDILEEAVASAERAIELAPDLAQAYASLGHAYRYQYRWVEAEQASLAAIKLDDRYPTAYQWYAVLLLDLGRGDEALAQIETAFQLAPLSLIISAWYAWTPDLLDQLDLAEPRYASLKEKFPREEFSYPWGSYFLRGDFDRAAEEFRQWRDLMVGPSTNIDRAAPALELERYWVDLLDRSTQQATLRQVVNDERVDPWVRAVAAAHVGDERVFQLLEPSAAISLRSIAARHPWVRNDPRYVTFLERTGLEP